MSGLITQPLGESGGGAMNLDTLPSSTAERVDPFALTRQIGRFEANSAARLGVTDPGTGEQIVPPEPTVDPAELNRKWGVAGPTPGLSLSFAAPLPESVAISMNAAKRDEIARANAAQRSPGGITSFLSDLGYGMLDPTGIAASALPVFGEARVGALLGRAGIDLGESIAGRAALRVATGAADATAANVPLVGLRYGLSQQEHADYGMADAAKDLAYGAVLGSVLHPALGALGDLARRTPETLPTEDPLAAAALATPAGRAIDADPELRAGAVHAATAAVLEDRPVALDPIQRRAQAVSALQAFYQNLGDRRAADAAAAEAEGLPRAEITGSRPEQAEPPDAIGLPGKSPVSLLEFLAATGGVRDEAGELRSMDATWRTRIGGSILVRQKGRSLDYAREAAEEAGYLPANSGVNDLLDAISSEMQGQRQYSRFDAGDLSGYVSSFDLQRDQEARANFLREEALPGAREDVRLAAEQADVTLRPEELEHAAHLTLDGQSSSEAIQNALRASQDEYERWLGTPEAEQALGAPRPEDAAAIERGEAAAAAPPLNTEAPSPELTQQLTDAEQAIEHARAAGLLGAADEADIAAMQDAAKASTSRISAVLQAAACVARGLA